MLKKLLLPFAVIIAVSFIFSACSKGSAAKVLPQKPETQYVNSLFDTALKIKFFLNDYMMKNQNYPESLKPLNYPAMTFSSTFVNLPDGSKKELITGILEEEGIHVRYEPTSYGKKDNPLLVVTAAKDPQNTASVQWANDVLSCVAYIAAPMANEACQTLKFKADNSNPLRNYYNLDDVLTPEHKQKIQAQVEDLLIEAALAKGRNAKPRK